MSQPKGYVDSAYLQLAADLTQPVKQQSYQAMRIQPGYRVLDVGCGPGTDTIALASLVGQGGQVVGVDLDPAMIAKACDRAEQEGVSAWVTHRVADALSLPFRTGEFDSARSERLLQHLDRPERALEEMVRVTKTGGWVVVLDTDWGTISMDTHLVDIERRLARVHAEHSRRNGYSGRRLYRLFIQQGLESVTARVFAMSSTRYDLARRITTLDDVENDAVAQGMITEEERARWRADLERADAEGTFFASLCMVMVSGRKTADV